MAEKVEEPLLHSGSWDEIEDGAFHSAITVQQLIALDPDNVIEYISKKGLVKLGTFKVQDAKMLSALQHRTFLTLGHSERDQYEQLWRKHLNKYADKTASKGWSRRLAVDAYVVNIKDAAAPDREGLVNPLLLKHDAGGCHFSVFALPAVQAVLQFKWDTYAGTWVAWELGCFLVWLVSASAFVLLYQDENDNLTLHQLVATPQGCAAVASQLLSCAAMLPFLLIEAGSMWAWGLRACCSAWNILDCLTYILQVAISALYLGRLVSGWLNVLVAFQCVLLWFRLNYFSRLLSGSGRGFSIIDSMQQVVFDIRVYLVYLVVMLWGFACAYHVLFRRDQARIKDFDDISTSMLTLLYYASKGVDLRVMLGCSHPDAAILLSLLFQFSTVTVIMSMLTGVVVKSMQKALDHEDMKRLLNKARAIDELEGTIPGWVERLMPQNYPAYVHVLRLSPDSAEETDLTLGSPFYPTLAHHLSLQRRCSLEAYYADPASGILSPKAGLNGQQPLRQTYTVPAGWPDTQAVVMSDSGCGNNKEAGSEEHLSASSRRLVCSSSVVERVCSREASSTVGDGVATAQEDASDQQDQGCNDTLALQKQLQEQNERLAGLELQRKQLIQLMVGRGDH